MRVASHPKRGSRHHPLHLYLWFLHHYLIFQWLPRPTSRPYHHRELLPLPSHRAVRKMLKIYLTLNMSTHSHHLHTLLRHRAHHNAPAISQPRHLPVKVPRVYRMSTLLPSRQKCLEALRSAPSVNRCCARWTMHRDGLPASLCPIRGRLLWIMWLDVVQGLVLLSYWQLPLWAEILPHMLRQCSLRPQMSGLRRVSMKWMRLPRMAHGS